jgi:hypothetical protein
MRDFDAQELFQILSEHLEIEFTEENEGDGTFVTCTISFDGDYLTSDNFRLDS